MDNYRPEEEEEQKGDSKDPYNPMAGRLTPYLADGGIVDDEQTKQPFVGPPAPSPVVPRKPLPGMGQDVQPDALQQMLGRYKSGMDQYGPEQQMAMRAALTKSNAGFLPSLARAGGGFADAVMQGVARAGPSNFQQSITNQQNKTMDDTMATMERAQGGKMAQIQAEMKMSMDDPNSPLSKIAQNAQRPTLLKLGWTDEQINKVSGNTAEEAAKSALSYEESKTRAEESHSLHELTFEAQRKAQEQARLKQIEDLKAGELARTQRGQEFEATHPIATGIQKFLGKQSIGPEGEETQRGGKTYVWVPSTGKYHLKK
jgi:hypothetical protein